MTKVIGGETEQAAEASPMGGSHGEGGRRRFAWRVRLNACPSAGKNAIPTTPLLLSFKVRSRAICRRRPSTAGQFNDGRTDRDKNDRRQDKNDQWRNHLDRLFSYSLLFGALPAFRAEGVGMHSEGLGYAGAEAVRLYQCTSKRTNIVNASSLYEVRGPRRGACRRASRDSTRWNSWLRSGCDGEDPDPRA